MRVVRVCVSEVYPALPKTPYLRISSSCRPGRLGFHAVARELGGPVLGRAFEHRKDEPGADDHQTADDVVPEERDVGVVPAREDGGLAGQHAVEGAARANAA